jgi:hypothetical protein
MVLRTATGVLRRLVVDRDPRIVPKHLEGHPRHRRQRADRRSDVEESLRLPPGDMSSMDQSRAEDLEKPRIADTWGRDSRGEHTQAVVKALDPEALDIDPRTYM